MQFFLKTVSYYQNIALDYKNTHNIAAYNHHFDNTIASFLLKNVYFVQT